ncbi:hypothetical protein NEF87_004458 [Candidatus Lokiarchaeum ossiferum]|uniref:DUF4129 domain-containing protein n=1 Tax=Candidatus Lokiarchaeum ossiferum TaxID=2951803 RepID=A0ABY6HXB7_9ARCH|nr:hypothetical protein NEF87_004458 [Candidatus Lokiarchaeum sp. B-35]
MARKKKGGGFDLGQKLNNIKTLNETKRPKEAIAYEYMLFVMLCTAKYKERKLPSQSVRDYAMKMVKEHDMDPTIVYPFIQAVEEVIYGGKPSNPEVFQKSLVEFGKVFEFLVGKPLPPM